MLRIFIVIAGMLLTTLAHANLETSCTHRKWTSVNTLLQKQKNLTKIGKNVREKCINNAMCDGQDAILELFVDFDVPSGLLMISKRCIEKAIKDGFVRAVKAVVDRGLSLRAIKPGETVLHLAAKSRRAKEFTQIFLEANHNNFAETGSYFFEIDKRSSASGKTALGEMLARKSYDAANLLFEMGASLVDAVYGVNKKEIETVVTPDHVKPRMVDTWFKTNTTEDVRDIFENKHNPAAHKKALFDVLSLTTNAQIKAELDRLWRKYEDKKLSHLLKKSKSSKKKSKALKPKKEEKVEVSYCLDACGREEGEQPSYCAIAKCHHRICQECLKVSKNYLMASETFTCPFDKCGSPILWSRVKHSGFDKEEVKAKLLKDKEKKLASTRKFHRCQRPDCPGGSFDSIKYGENLPEHYQCAVCGSLQCAKCKKAHPKLDCAEKEIEKNESYIEEQKKLKNIKPCPNCENLIEKHLGCDHMKCSQCKQNFYWSSLRPFK